MRTLAALAVGAGIALLAPAAAHAHAVLTHSTPHRGATVQDAPPRVVLDFNEPIEAGFGAVRVFDGDGERVDRGGIEYPAGHQRSVAVAVRGGLPRGVYTATYRVISADGHPVSGGFSFGVGVAAANGGDAPDVAELLEETDAGGAVEVSYGVVRGLHYAALLLLVGAVAFWARLAPAASPWPGRLLLGAALIGLVTALLGIGLQGALGAGVGLGRITDSAVLEASLDTRTGTAWAVRAGAWLALVALLAATARPRRARALAAAAALLVLVVSLPLGGHASTQAPEAVLVPADVGHVLAAGVWLGGLVLLIVAFWPGRRAPDEAAAEATRRFSDLALPAIVVLVAAGLVQSWFYLGSPGELFGGDAYSLALIAKIALLAGVLALAAGNRRRVKELAASGGLRGAMRAEVALAVLVLAATAVLVREAPPESLASGPASRELDLGPMRLEMVIEPPATGPNDFHLYFFDRRTGAQVDRVEEVEVRLVHRGEELAQSLTIPRKGPAHYELLDQPLAVDGEWEVAVDARVSEFDVYSARTEIEVRKK